MSALIICASVSHGNTRRIADAMGQVLDARVVEPEHAPTDISAYDLIGFGSGIYYNAFHASLRAFVTALDAGQRGRAFTFATSGFADSGMTAYSKALVEMLAGKGFDMRGSFSCRGFDTWLPFKLVGGLHKGHPDTNDLVAARNFAGQLRS